MNGLLSPLSSLVKSIVQTLEWLDICIQNKESVKNVISVKAMDGKCSYKQTFEKFCNKSWFARISEPVVGVN